MVFGEVSFLVTKVHYGFMDMLHVDSQNVALKDLRHLCCMVPGTWFSKTVLMKEIQKTAWLGLVDFLRHEIQGFIYKYIHIPWVVPNVPMPHDMKVSKLISFPWSS